MPPLFDTHAHIDDDKFDDDRAEVIQRAQEAGLVGILAVGCTRTSSLACVELAESHENVWASVGVQPNYCSEVQDGDWDAIVKLTEHPRVIALGETGLDCYWDRCPLELQRDYFDRHLRLSQALDLPFIVHTRNSDAPVLEMLREARSRGPLRGVMHSFAGEAETCHECVEMGLYISFAGMVTFKKSDELRTMAATVPDDRLLVETDSPYLSPHPLRGKRNEPARVEHTAKCLAEVRGVDFKTLAEQTTANAKRLLKLG